MNHGHEPAKSEVSLSITFVRRFTRGCSSEASRVCEKIDSARTHRNLFALSYDTRAKRVTASLKFLSAFAYMTCFLI